MRDIREVRKILEKPTINVVVGSFNKSKREDGPSAIKVDTFNGTLILRDNFVPGREYLPRFIELGRAFPSKDGTTPEFVLNSVFIRTENQEGEEPPETRSKLIGIGSLQKSKKEDGLPFVKVDHYKATLIFKEKETGKEHKVDHLFFGKPLPNAPQFQLNTVTVRLEKE